MAHVRAAIKKLTEKTQIRAGSTLKKITESFFLTPKEYETKTLCTAHTFNIITF